MRTFLRAACSPGALRTWLWRLARSSESPHRTAGAFALGVFLSFSPLLGLQIVTGLMLAALLRLGRVPVMIGLCTNLPWLMLPWYTLTTVAGAAVLGVPLGGDFGARLGDLLDLPVYTAAFWKEAIVLAKPFAWCFVLGSTAGALVVGAVSYLGVARFIARVHASDEGLPAEAGP